MVHVGDFLCIGSIDELVWLHVTLRKKYDLKKHMLEPESRREVKYLNRIHRRGGWC